MYYTFKEDMYTTSSKNKTKEESLEKQTENLYTRN